MTDIPESACRFMGFFTYEDAHYAWSAFKDNGTLPNEIAPLNANIVCITKQVRNRMLQRRSSSSHRNEVRRSQTQPPGTSAAYQPIPSRSNNDHVLQSPDTSATSQPLLPSRNKVHGTQTQPPAASTAFQLIVAAVPGTNVFWIIFEGPRPGVYLDL